VPAKSTAPAATSAAPVENAAPAPSASGGPNTHVSSTADASKANARGSSSKVRTQAPIGGVASPIPAASAIRTPSATPTGRSATAIKSETEADAEIDSTAVWPRRSTRRPSGGPPTPRAIA
jgi:hypothetical protein